MSTNPKVKSSPSKKLIIEKGAYRPTGSPSKKPPTATKPTGSSGKATPAKKRSEQKSG